MATMTDTASATGIDATSGRIGRPGVQDSTPVKDNLKEDIQKTYKHTFVIHDKTRTSRLSRDSESTPSFVGFRNLMVLMLVMSNLRLVMENFKKYGVLVTLSGHEYRRQDVLFGWMLYLLVPCHLLVAYIIELVAARQAKAAIARIKKTDDPHARSHSQQREKRTFQTTWAFIALAHGINATLNLCIATTVVYYYIHHPGIGTICELHAVIVWLKACSYALTNRDLRHALLSPSGSAPLPDLYKQCPYPNNITFSNLAYFWWAPTLVYQPVYPRTADIRWDFVVKRLLETAVAVLLIWILSAQYAAPLLQNSLDTVSTVDLGAIVERTLKLSTISLACWLAGFFALFQSFLNALAEVMRFGDREFYTDWWNSYSVRSYWSSWNKPVFHFMRRHIYAPLVGRGCPRLVAQIVVFLFSGILHELLVGVPTHNVIGVAFVGMMLQLPLVAITDPLSRTQGMNWKTLGNVIFWISFCLVFPALARTGVTGTGRKHRGHIANSLRDELQIDEGLIRVTAFVTMRALTRPGDGDGQTDLPTGQAGAAISWSEGG
ncbi:MAG: hypothetical protein M1820_001685 [Bogoriella megaspora]|nr:MAG: hypothetical protein M1820_001685 [Bogoriella megaspora]